MNAGASPRQESDRGRAHGAAARAATGGYYLRTLRRVAAIAATGAIILDAEAHGGGARRRDVAVGAVGSVGASRASFGGRSKCAGLLFWARGAATRVCDTRQILPLNAVYDGRRQVKPL